MSTINYQFKRLSTNNYQLSILNCQFKRLSTNNYQLSILNCQFKRLSTNNYQLSILNCQFKRLSTNNYQLSILNCQLKKPPHNHSGAKKETKYSNFKLSIHGISTSELIFIKLSTNYCRGRETHPYGKIR